MAVAFTIFTLGDVKPFQQVLNGVAMLFNGNGTFTLWHGNNPLGLGMGALFGLTLMLIILIYNAALKRQWDWKNFITPMIVYFVLTAPKVDVNVEDIYTSGSGGTAVKVSNVPLGLALPASAVSGISFALTEAVETVFSTVSGTYTKITEEGYVTPLKLLNTLRYSGSEFASIYPNFTKSLNQVYIDCASQSDKFDPQAYLASADPWGKFITAVKANGALTTVYTPLNPTGYLTTCSDAATKLETSLNSFYDGTSNTTQNPIIPTQANQIFLKQLITTNMEGNSANTGGQVKFDQDDMETMFNRMFKMQSLDARRFVMGTLTHPIITGASMCATDATDFQAISHCSSWADSTEQWKEKAAASGTGFVRIMNDGQNMLIFIAYILFPIMVLMIVLNAMGGMKVLFGFLTFFISANLWLPIAAMVNYYIGMQVQNDLIKFKATTSSPTILTLANAPAFYASISQKLALASSLMASVPAICMGIFAGMLFPASKLADRMNQAADQGYDAKRNTPDSMKQDAIAGNKSYLTMQGDVASLTGKQSLSTLSSSGQASQSYAQSMGYRKEIQDSFRETDSKLAAYEKSHQNSWSRQQIAQDAQSKGYINQEQYGAYMAYLGSQSQTSGTVNSSGTASVNSDSQQNATTAQAQRSGSASIGGGVSGGVGGSGSGGSIGAMLGVKGSGTATGTKSQSTTETAQSTQNDSSGSQSSVGNSNLYTNTHGGNYGNTQTNTMSTTSMAAVTAGLNKVYAERLASSNNFAEAREASQTAAQTESQMRSIESSQSQLIRTDVNGTQLLNRFKGEQDLTNGLIEKGEQLAEANPEFKKQYETQLHHLEEHTDTGKLANADMGNERKAAALLLTAQQMGTQNASIREYAADGVAAVAGFSGAAQIFNPTIPEEGLNIKAPNVQQISNDTSGADAERARHATGLVAKEGGATKGQVSQRVSEGVHEVRQGGLEGKFNGANASAEATYGHQTEAVKSEIMAKYGNTAVGAYLINQLGDQAADRTRNLTAGERQNVEQVLGMMSPADKQKYGKILLPNDQNVGRNATTSNASTTDAFTQLDKAVSGEINKPSNSNYQAPMGAIENSDGSLTATTPADYKGKIR